MADSSDATLRDVSAQGSVVAGMTVLSRISGMVRDVVLSHVLGAGPVADTFFLALRIPNFFRRLFAEGAFAQAFVPVLSEYQERGGKAALQAFVAAMTGNLGAVLVAVTVLGVLGAAGLAAAFMPGLLAEPERFALAVDLTRIMFPYLALVSLAAFAGAVLNANNRYAIPAFTPVLLNLALVFAALWSAGMASLSLEGAVHALAWGVLAAGAAQLLVQVPSLARVGLLVAPKMNWSHPGARKVGVLLVPAALGASAGQVNALIGTIIASLLEEGSPSWLYYADRLMELPIGIVAIALGTVLLTNLSRLHNEGEAGKFNDTLDWGMRIGLLLGIPATVALAVLAYPLVATIFLHGEMRPRDADMTAAALRAFAIGLVPLVLVKIAGPGYLARQDAATPFKFAIASYVVNIVVSLATFRWLGHIGIALATSIAAFVNAALLIGGLVRAKHYRPSRELVRVLTITTAGTATMALALWYGVPGDAWWLAASVAERVGALSIAVSGGLVTYAAVVVVAGIRPKDLRHRA